MAISIDQLVKRFDNLKNNRVNWDNLWQDCANYCLPQKAIVTDTRSPGTKLNTRIYDSTAIQAAQIFAAGLHSYLTNPSSKWFSLKMQNRKLMEIGAVKDWLKESEDTIFDYLNSSNFNQVIHEDYVDFGVFGTSTLYEEEDPENEIAFFVRPPAEIYILVNEQGKIDTIYRHFTYTARQAFQKWGKNSGQKVLDLMKAGKVEDEVAFLHIVLPRHERDTRKKDAVNMPFSSLYIEKSKRKVLSEGGYEEFPYFVGRAYKVSDSEYAYSPASLALADIRMLNQMSRDILEAAQKTLHPPIILPNDGYIMPFKTTPKAINYKLSSDPNEKVETLQLNREIGLSLEMENQRRASIQKAFFVDLFLMLAGLPNSPQRTATEIAERVNERMLILGPILGRLMHEKLDPIITRTFNILRRRGKMPEPPEQLLDEDYKVEYISPLAKAQRASEIKSYGDLMIATREMMEIDPSVIDNINSDKALKRVADVTNTSDVLRTEDEVKAIREERFKAEEVAKATEQARAAGEAGQAVVGAVNELEKQPAKKE